MECGFKENALKVLLNPAFPFSKRDTRYYLKEDIEKKKKFNFCEI